MSKECPGCVAAHSGSITHNDKHDEQCKVEHANREDLLHTAICQAIASPSVAEAHTPIIPFPDPASGAEWTQADIMPLLEYALQSLTVDVPCGCDRGDANVCAGTCAGSMIWNAVHRARKLIRAASAPSSAQEAARQAAQEIVRRVMACSDSHFGKQIDEWRDISSAPKDGRTVLLGYENLNSKWRTLRGQWFNEQAILDEWEEPADGSEGWYETSAQADDPPNCRLVCPTHWQPLPSPPKLNNSIIKDPIIIYPPGQTAAAGWDDLRAAFGADPGCCSCPNCKQMFWAFGRVIQCTECGFEFPTDWWGMYSYGVNASRPDPPYVANLSNEAKARMAQLHQDRLAHPYYKYGFEHPVADAWEEHDKLSWKQIIEAPQT